MEGCGALRQWNVPGESELVRKRSGGLQAQFFFWQFCSLPLQSTKLDPLCQRSNCHHSRQHIVNSWIKIIISLSLYIVWICDMVTVMRK